MYWGSRGGAPSGVQGQSAWLGCQGGETPLKLKAFGNHVQNFRLNISCFLYFYHVHMLYMVHGLRASKRNVPILATACDWKGGVAGLPPWTYQCKYACQSSTIFRRMIDSRLLLSCRAETLALSCEVAVNK